MSFSKNQTKVINKLRQKKYRMKEGLFVAEGIKVVKELLASSFELDTLFVTEAASENFTSYKVEIVNEVDLKKLSSLKSPNGVLALFKIPVEKALNSSGLVLVLDEVNDPGNLGTIIRLCDWFGIQQLVCSVNTVDCYNEKVVQSTMGSLSRVAINYVDLLPFLEKCASPMYIADMVGENVYEAKLPKEAVLIMGNEANGISDAVRDYVTNSLSIPRFGVIQATESLNVATATSILLSEFRRRV
ncbi:TrmH family RNA methyltransferase [Flavicella sediminum]|uniref:TrmH family RNA methyltransferase n=1 Tax=Flavicella sediminum TaxID=2585141 RepID=UPI00111E7AA4|nr:RNA methyltransferase [Flavicella sediminum]